jgi:hypothetical protein
MGAVNDVVKRPLRNISDEELERLLEKGDVQATFEDVHRNGGWFCTEYYGGPGTDGIGRVHVNNPRLAKGGRAVMVDLLIKPRDPAIPAFVLKRIEADGIISIVEDAKTRAVEEE